MQIKDNFTKLYIAAFLWLFSISLTLAEPLNFVAFGDSLMAGYQLPQDDAYPNRLAEKLGELGHEINMNNASVSGDTTSGGLSRLDWSIPDGTDAVLLGLGANDALRGIPLDNTRDNLDAMVARLKERNIEIILMGMLAPPNMGDDYAKEFNAIYPSLSEKYDVALYPFFLDGVAANSALNLDDGIHPNPEGIKVLVENSIATLEAFVGAIKD